SCSECIRGGPECAWCEDKDYFVRQQPADRCDSVLNHQKNKCQKLTNPKSGTDSKQVKNKKLDDSTNVTPRNLTLHLRKGQPARFNVSMRTPENFPVDLYYLMDISGSMFQDMQQITSLGKRIATEMNKITTRFRLGFGTFVDKPVAPFIDTQPELLAHPRLTDTGIDLDSIPAFGFRNNLPLDQETSKFEAKVAAQNISGNVDNPEGGMDALLQIAVCHKDIGWVKKEEARRLVVLTTDANYHFAGDGLLGGIVTPNDGKCHLSAEGEYEASTLQDYPSLGQLREILIENQVVPIFAITQNQKAIYDVLQNFFGDQSFAVAAELEADGSNVVTLIREAYEKIAKTQTVSDNTTTGVTITYKAICPDGTFENKQVCNNVKIGEEVTFEVSVTALECSDKMPDRVNLRTVFGEVALNLKYICECKCQELEQHKSSYCSRNGTLICGECECDPEWTGRRCDCQKGTADDPSKCPKNNATGQVCSGRGKCYCAECICDESKVPGEEFYGDHCQCSNMDCPRNDEGLLCGGPEQGKCDCGKCSCYGNWTGPACSCTTETASCFENGAMCSGRGECECGKCVCNASLPYIGVYCNDCPVRTCSGQCNANKACVQCKVFGTGPLQNECQEKCSDDVIKVNIVDKITEEMGERCSFQDDDDCTFTFAYQPTDDYRLEVFVEKERACPEQVAALVVILGVIFGILAIGLALLLIWRLLATIQDRREFAKFEKERSQAKWDTGENPIFINATTTFQNPTYKKA
ncbi:predicted protein, partial [Nematostella vectensis]